MGELEVNESLLTGESDGVAKARGDELLSGSSVISGKGFARVTHVGKENYATRLAEEVKREKAVESELLASMRKVTRLTSFLIIPLGILLLMEALVVRNGAVDTAVVSSAAALLGMLPKGLVLCLYRYPSPTASSGCQNRKYWCRTSTHLRLWPMWIHCVWTRREPLQTES